jgi:hypothetical protein
VLALFQTGANHDYTLKDFHPTVALHCNHRIMGTDLNRISVDVLWLEYIITTLCIFVLLNNHIIAFYDISYSADVVNV